MWRPERLSGLQVVILLNAIAEDGSGGGSVSGSDDTRTSAQAQGGGLIPNTAEIGLVAKDGTKWEYVEFSSGSRDRLQAQNVLTESGICQYAYCDAQRMPDGSLSAFELLVNNAMLIHV
ncbi:unnamed protein product [Clavelina lepadiformis]|uniref:Uncharacterized protein n=1 Tax=Clavelina lepadiformis TaxID=159417 RepID=A0ABP0FMT4_CLALP